MSERRYSVSEIDAMRAAVQRRATRHLRGVGIPYMFAGSVDDFARSQKQDWDSATQRAEEELRTYMLAGVDPDEVVRALAEAKPIPEPSLEVQQSEKCPKP